MDEQLKFAEEVAEQVTAARKSFRELIDKAAALDKILASWGMTWEQYQGRRTDTQVLPVDEQMQPRGTDAVAEFTAADYLQTGTGEACSDTSMISPNTK